VANPNRVESRKLQLLNKSKVVAGNKFPGGAILSTDLMFAAFNNPHDQKQVIIYAIHGKFQDQIVAQLIPDPTYSAQNPEFGKMPFGVMYPTRFGRPKALAKSFKMTLGQIYKQLTGDTSGTRKHYPVTKR